MSRCCGGLVYWAFSGVTLFAGQLRAQSTDDYGTFTTGNPADSVSNQPVYERPEPSPSYDDEPRYRPRPEVYSNLDSADDEPAQPRRTRRKEPDGSALRQKLLWLKQQPHPEPPVSACAHGRVLQRPLGGQKSTSKAAKKSGAATATAAVPPAACGAPTVAVQARACKAHDAAGCWNLARLNQVGTGLSQNLPYAAELYKQACDAGFAPGCTDLGEMSENGTGIPKDGPAALALYQRACQSGDAQGCGDAGVYLDLVAHDLTQAIPFMQTACNAADALSCMNLAFLYANGRGVPHDDARAATLMAQACDGGQAQACDELGHAYASITDQALASSFYDFACFHDYPRGCMDLAALYYSGEGVAQDRARSAKLNEKGCSGGNAKACLRGARAYESGTGVPQDTSHSATLYEQACNRGNAWGCAELASKYSVGMGVPQDKARAATLFQRACAKGNKFGCGMALATSLVAGPTPSH